MAAATVDSSAAANNADRGALRLDSIPIVDLRLLSQSELYSLSRCSSSAFDPSRRDDVVIPIIDRSVFNESAGSRKQTYSRLRLAPSSYSSTTPRRRTPHLRSTAANFGNSNNKSDPENAENAQIVNLLKQLFVADMNPEDLVPVKIEYSNSLLMQQLSSPTPSSPSNVGPTGQKRKRGRPRRDEVLGNEMELGAGFGVVDVEVAHADGFSSLNEIVVRENGEERDREVLNKDGVAVDVAALGAVEHPYWGEISRRTDGLQTEEEMLGFLKGLNGLWGSRRKKRRIVDASEFGSFLPIGWKLSLSVKKKNGHVWLYCRRYISPSGLHFVSCKGVSSYLLSLHGLQDRNLHSSAQYNEIVNDADKLTSATGDVGKEKLVSHASLPALDSITGNHDMEIVNAVGFPEDRIGEILYCNNSAVSFNEKDELLQHQSSFHRKNKHKNGMRITDGVIITDGKYECQFCHKTFSERHRYNGHVGTHVRYQAKAAGESSESVDPSSLSEFPIRDVSVEGSHKSNIAVDICNSISNNGLNICAPCNNNNNNALVGDLVEANESTRGIDEAIDIVPEIIMFSVAVNKGFHEDKLLNCSAAKMIEDGSSLQGRMSDSSLPLSDTAHGVMNGSVVENCASIEKPEQIMASKSFLLDSDDHVEECTVVHNNENIYQTRNEINLDCEKFAVNGTGNTDGASTTGADALKFNELPNISILCLAHDEKTRVEDVSKKDDTEALTHILEVPGLQDMSKNQLVTGHESMYHYESNDDGVCRKKKGIPEFDDFQNFLNGASSDPLSSSHTGANPDSISGAEQERKLGVCSPFTSATDKHLFTEDNMTRISNETLEEHRQEPSGGMLLGQSGVSEISHEAYPFNKIYATPANPSKLNEIENTGKHGLSLSFGNFQTEMGTDPNRVEQEMYQANNFNTESVMHKPYGDPTHLSIISNISGDLKQEKPFETGFPNSSFNISTHKLGSSFNMTHPGKEWNGIRGDKNRASGQNFMVGFGNSSPQSGECFAADGSWRSGLENMFGGCFDANSGPQMIPSSSCFHTFDLTSDKGEERSFDVNKNYDIQSDMLRPGRTQPVEYSFMSEQSSNSLPGESEIYTYSANMEQGLDPSFWLGKDALTPNASHTSQVTSLCVWCRNVFFHEQVQAGMQTGAIGTMCPSCSARIPGQ